MNGCSFAKKNCLAARSITILGCAGEWTCSFCEIYDKFEKYWKFFLYLVMSLNSNHFCRSALTSQFTETKMNELFWDKGEKNAIDIQKCTNNIAVALPKLSLLRNFVVLRSFYTHRLKAICRLKMSFVAFLCNSNWREQNCLMSHYGYKTSRMIQLESKFMASLFRSLLLTDCNGLMSCVGSFDEDNIFCMNCRR